MKQRFDNTQFIKLNTFHQTNFKSFQMHKKNQNLRKNMCCKNTYIEV